MDRGSSIPVISAAAPLAWRHIQDSCNGSTTSISAGTSTLNCMSILPATNDTKVLDQKRYLRSNSLQ